MFDPRDLYLIDAARRAAVLEHTHPREAPVPRVVAVLADRRVRYGAMAVGAVFGLVAALLVP